MLGSWKYTLPETNSSHLKMDGWNTNFLLGRPIFQGRTVSFTEGLCVFFLVASNGSSSEADHLSSNFDFEKKRPLKLRKAYRS